MPDTGSPGEPWSSWPTMPPAPRPLRAGEDTVVGPYQVEALLGEGGMGRVYLGRTRAGRAVAVKVVHRQYASDPAFRKRFEREVETAKRVHGLYTASVVDADVEADEPWLATAYIPGPSLQYTVTEHGPLPAEAALRLVAGVAEALQSIHDAGVIHRDLKPSNVILTADGPTVIDFGIARAADVTAITNTDIRLGTPTYMAPEQIRGEALTPAVDIFTLGVLASFAATGRPAFGGGEGVFYRILEQPPDLDGCPEPVRGIAAACLTKDREQRPTPAEVVERCHRSSVGPPPAAAPHPLPTFGPEGGAQVPEPVVPAHIPAPPVAPPATPAPDLGPRTTERRLTRRRLLAAAGLVGGVGLGVTVPIVWLSRPDSEGPTPPTSRPATTGSPLPKPRIADSLRDHPKTVFNAVAISPEATMLAASTFNPGGEDADGSVILVWDLATREQIFKLTDPGGAGTGIVFSPDESVLVAANHNFGTVNLFDLDLGAKIATLDAQVSSPEGIAVSKDGSVLAVGSGAYETDTDSKDFSIKLYDLSGQDKGTLRGHKNSVNCVAFSPDGTTLASGGEDATIKFWDVSGKSELLSLTDIGAGPAASLAYSPDGRFLAIGDILGAVQLWEFETQKAVPTLSEDGTSVFRVEFSPDGALLAVAYYGVELWDVAGKKEIATLGGPYAGDAMTFSPDGQTIAVTGEKGTIDLWRIR